jgi:hypothetical protein
MESTQRYVATCASCEWYAGCFPTTDAAEEMATVHRETHADHRVTVRAITPGER